MNDVYEKIRVKGLELLESKKLLNQPVRVRARALSTQEAIGNPESDDFPLQKGKERLMQAEFLGAKGQAFTDQYGNFDGLIEDILNLNLKNNFRRAVFTATLNAALCHLKQIEKTVHCRDKGPSECAAELVHHLKSTYGNVNIAQIGFQPRMVEFLAANFSLRVFDLDLDNIGTNKFNITIEGPEKTQDAIQWADLVLVTGTTLVNGTITEFLGKKPVLFYGTTIAGAAHLMNWDRFCYSSE
jgi:hypothetical protein